ncbi:MAG TPA: hypothetical protein VH083_23630 [Myxococcales bacterium]|nr:hypothetical protein [Myxococcales bacterium]
MERTWAREAVDSALEEVRLYLRTAGSFARHPGVFSAEWAAGERHAMNPLGFFASSLAVIGVLGQLERFWPAPGDSKPSFLGDALEATGPYLHAVVLALLIHALLRARGSRRPVLDSVAAALYAGGIAQVAASFFLAVLQAAFRKPLGEIAQVRWATALIAFSLVGPAVFFAVAIVLALAALHGMPRRWPLLGFVLAWSLTGALLSLLNPPGHYGLHPVIRTASDTANIGLGF